MMQYGENMSLEYSDQGVGSNILALSQIVRGGDPKGLVDTILQNGSYDEVVDLFVLIFVTRNCRGGKGEKKLAFDLFLRVWIQYPDTGRRLLGLFPTYGYWKDLLLLMVAAKEVEQIHDSETLITACIALMKDQYEKDIASLALYDIKLKDEAMEERKVENEKAGPTISLLAKWLPREGSSFDKKLEFVRRFTAESILTTDTTSDSPWQSTQKARYRRQVARLTSFLALPEVLLSAKREEEIQFGRVAARATMILRKVFMNETKLGEVRSLDPKRIRMSEDFTSHIFQKGLKGGQLMPHEIVGKIIKGGKISSLEELVYDSMWKDLWRNVTKEVQETSSVNDTDFKPTCMVPLCDVSGSMSGIPMEVAIGLSIGLSEITHESYRNKILTFSSTPEWHNLNPTDTIVQKVRSLQGANWDMSTDFVAAFDLLLDIAVKNNLKREDIPALIVFSDMQFDEAGGNDSNTIHETIQGKINIVANELGWEDRSLPPMVYWNLRTTGGHPVEKDTEGTVLLSGFSPSMLKLVMNGDALRDVEVEVVNEDGTLRTETVRVTPQEVLRKMLDDHLYDPVREVLLSSEEKLLSQYNTPRKGTFEEDAVLV